jgi:hypothetical protein
MADRETYTGGSRVASRLLIVLRLRSLRSVDVRFRDAAAVALVAGAVMVACGGDGAASTTTSFTTTPPPETTTTLATTTTRPPPSPPVEVTGFDYGYEGLPAVLPRGTRFTFSNSSTTEFHEMAIIKLDDGDDRTLAELAQLSAPEIERTGTLISVTLARPGQEQYSSPLGTPRAPEPGRYIVFCTVPVGSDPADVEDQASRGPYRQVEGVPAHFQVGMIAEFTAIE